MKKSTQIIGAVLIITLIILGVILFTRKDAMPPVEQTSTTTPTVLVNEQVKTIGTSVEGRNIFVHEFVHVISARATTSAEKHILFVGGIHGGYEWNSSLLAYEVLEAIRKEKESIPANIRISIIPTLNPDGHARIVGKEGYFTQADGLAADAQQKTNGVPVGTGRFNANNVDLNRNFDCKWQPESTWRNQKVSAGTSAFSEPEAMALRDYVLSTAPQSVIFWHSQANAVYASECEQGVLPATTVLMNTYGAAVGYKTIASFDAYPVSGDAEGWLASIHIPAITVELANHTDSEFVRNWSAVRKLIWEN